MIIFCHKFTEVVTLKAPYKPIIYLFSIIICTCFIYKKNSQSDHEFVVLFRSRDGDSSAERYQGISQDKKNRCLQLVQQFKKKLLCTSVLVIILSPF